MAQSKPRLRSSTVGGTRTYDGGISSQSLVKPSSVGHGTHLFNNKASLASKLFEFYDKTVAETELMVEAIDLPDGATNSAKITGAKRILRNARIPSRMRHNMTGEVFWSKAERVIEVRERIQFKDLSLLPPRPPTKSKKSSSSVGRLSAEKFKLDISSTVLAAQLKSFDIPTTTNTSSSPSAGQNELSNGVAIPLCLPNDMEWNPTTRKCKKFEDIERSSLKLCPLAVKILGSITGPVCVVSIVGPCRSGKSYILSRLISSVGTQCHFDLGHQMDPKTMGIWMWDSPFKITLENGKQVTLVLLDTEGIDAANASDQGDNQIFTLSVLMSSLLIYNSMNVPRREDLNQLHFVANLSKSIQVQSGQTADGLDELKLTESNPRFMWLLRDVILEPTNSRGCPCHIRDYLLQKVLKEEATDDDTQKSIRRCLLSFFRAFDAETLPPPSVNQHVMQNIENPAYQKDLNPNFLHKVEYIRKRIFKNCEAKRGFTAGSVVSGFQLAQMVKLYVEALNSPNGIPAIGSTWQRVLEATYTNGLEEALKSYQAAMDAAITGKLPMGNQDLLNIHRRAVRKSLEMLKHTTSVDCERKLFQEYLDKLMTQLAQYQQDGECVGGRLALYLKENLNKSHSTCQSLLTRLKERHLDPLIKNLTPSTDFKVIERAFLSVVSQYNERSIGPAAGEVLERFIKEQEKEMVTLEGQLSLIKNYDAEAKQRIDELRKHSYLIEQKEREQAELMDKMLQSKWDNEAKLQAMNDKFSRDMENLRKESEKRLKEQDSRLQNMADGKQKTLRDENKKKMDAFKKDLDVKKKEFETQHASLSSQLEQQKAEVKRIKELQEQQQQQQQLAQNASKGRGGGCFAAGTMVTRSDGTVFPIEKQADGIRVLALGGEFSLITEEYVEAELRAGERLFGINDKKPFAAFQHPFWTTEGWKCLNPALAKEENPNVDFKLLQVGDTVFKVEQTDPLLYRPVKIMKFAYQTLSAPIKIYGLHLDGPHSYHANGYAVAANYPVLTKMRIMDGMERLSEEEREKLSEAMTSTRRELTKVLGCWSSMAFEEMGLFHKEEPKKELGDLL